MANTILLADDNEKLRRSLTHILEESGYLVVEAATGTEALRLLNSSAEFDLLITDLVMPDMEGLELITRLPKFSSEAGNRRDIRYFRWKVSPCGQAPRC